MVNMNDNFNTHIRKFMMFNRNAKTDKSKVPTEPFGGSWTYTAATGALVSTTDPNL